MLSDDLEGHFTVQQKLGRHCKVIILQFKKIDK